MNAKLPNQVVAALVLAAGSTRAQLIVVPNGGDLVAAVAAAPDGSVIELQSDGTFVGRLHWSAKALTIRAGAGFAPTIAGSFDEPAATLSNASPYTVGVFEGLRLVGGPSSTTFEAHAFSASGTGSGLPGTQATFRDCSFGTRVSMSGTGDHHMVAVFERCHLESVLSLGGTGDLVGTVDMTDCRLDRGFGIGTTGRAHWDATLRRNLLEDGIGISTISNSTASVLAESCLLRARVGAALVGVRTSGTLGAITARFVNLTVSGFTLGAEALDAGTTFENLLFHGNLVDLDASIGAAQIANSLIPDGAFAGVNGNVQGIAVLDADGALVVGGAGIDAGNDAAAGLGLLDLYGAPRLQDGDGDGTPRVNLGAVETPSCAPLIATNETVRLGTPANPNALAPGLSGGPVAGRTWDPRVDHTTFLPTALFDLLAVSVQSTNVFLPDNGTLLIDPGRIRALHFSPASSPFAIPVPSNCGVVGRNVSAQAVSFGPVGGMRLTNAIDAVIGVY